MKRIKLLLGRKGIDNIMIVIKDNNVFIISGDYLLVYNEIKKLWNNGESPKSYISEISRRINKDKSWVMKIIDELVKKGLIKRYMRDGYKRKAFYRPSDGIIDNINIKDVYFEVRDYRIFDIVFLISSILVMYLIKDQLFIEMWIVIVLIIELILHSK